MKRTVNILFLAAITFCTFGQKTETRYLSGIDKDHTVAWDFFCTKGMNSGKWTSIQVPSQWELQGFGAYNYGQDKKYNDEQGLYRYSFDVPKTWKKKKVYIVFEGSMTDTEVKINGKSAGAVHQGAFYRFRYDISKLLKFGTKNLLEVTVSKESSNPTVNRAERRGDYWVLGGIYRPVYLEAFPSVFIDHLAVDARADGSFNMDVVLNGLSKPGKIEAQLQTLEGKDFGSPVSVEVASGSSTVRVTGRFSDPVLWTPESPNLYNVVVSLKDGENIIHQLKQRFGFRTVEVRQGDGIYVNNKKIMFRGVCRHSAWPTSGRCMSKDLSLSDANLIKDMNMNAVRMSHYPPDQYFLDVCDSLGLFVLDELAGWHGYYDTPTGQRIVKEMVERDVNHPSIVLWDNGNEGGFNKDLRTEYAKYDPQNRQVIEPWAKLNGMDTKHYPDFKYVSNALDNGGMIYFPTEFLHGLYDGGHGAGLDDYWELMNSKPLSAGGFLWVFADEGIVRKDLHDSIDTHGNYAPDGIVGPFREKEGSFYTIREIWSPVHIKNFRIDGSFEGKIPVANRFLYTHFGLCRFSCELVKYSGTFPDMDKGKQPVPVDISDLAPGDSGAFALKLPGNWRDYDALCFTAVDPFGRLINQWSWNIVSPEAMSAKIVKATEDRVAADEQGDYIILSSGKVSAGFSKTTGLLTRVESAGQTVSFTNGPLFAGDSLVFKSLKHYRAGNSYVVEISYDKSPESYTKWTMLPGGWLQLEYQYHPVGRLNFAGITFSYPESSVTGAELLANGPYHVWKNRLKGTGFGFFNKFYNNTKTGETWSYPEFKGYYDNFFAVKINTKELPFTIVSATPGLYLHLFSPQVSRFSKGGTNPPFPSGDISILNGISAIGTKFSQPEVEGPQSQKNEFLQSNVPLKGKVYFRFGD